MFDSFQQQLLVADDVHPEVLEVIAAQRQQLGAVQPALAQRRHVARHRRAQPCTANTVTHLYH